ncbi:MAG: hypothetical protein EWM47_11270 [Anaerolineaceae bacterium]|nr:MAG: hypothetical protein EWM47_11270 [Anaerolineaceae bacterium]
MNWKKPAKRIIYQFILIASVGIIVTAIILFMAIELRNHKTSFINNYEKEQQVLTNQVSIRMNYYMVSGQMDISEAISTVINEVETSGSKFWFIAENEEMLFVRDQNTSKLFEFISLSSFIKQSRDDNMSISSSSFIIGDNQYTVGLCVKEAYMNDIGRVSQHYIYIIMPIIVISAMIIVILVISILHISKQEDRIKELEDDAIERNKTIEKLNISIKQLQLEDVERDYNMEETIQKTIIYNREVLISLLDKIKKENIVPLTIIVVELSTSDKSQNEDNYHKIIKSVSRLIDKEHVIAEVEPHIFTILLFKTRSDSSNDIKDTLVNKWAIPLKRQGFIIRMGLSSIDNYDAKVDKVFDLIYREVMKGIIHDKR